MSKNKICALAAAALTAFSLLPAVSDQASVYTVQAASEAADSTSDTIQNKVKVELECTDDAGGWNSSTIPVYLVDSNNVMHMWDVSCDALDSVGKTVSHEFEIGAASPVYIAAYPDFGGGFTARSFGLKARTWLNGKDKFETKEVMIRSYPFVRSTSREDYMHLSFEGFGMTRICSVNADGTYSTKKEVVNCMDGWRETQDSGDTVVIQLQSAWLLEDCLTVGNTGKTQESVYAGARTTLTRT